ncbi:MAG TPA: twin-arginine translocase TatA/TatE family subunit [Solirubrobacterales bacterium]|nr:twin-arginine translocase TatA/TatE family subunit [Solirubrobacterales bacterium]
MIGNIGPLEIGIVLLIALLVFGPRRLPELGNSLGRGIRDFGKGIKGEETETAPVEIDPPSARARPRWGGVVGRE